MSDHQTTKIRARYDRIAPLYDRLEPGLERRYYAHWRAQLWRQAVGPRILEIGVGTGKNLPLHPPDAQVTAIDFSPRMLAQAQQRTQQLGSQVQLCRMDAQALAFPDQTFHTVVATFVFGSIPDPVQALREVARILKPGACLLMLEYVRPPGPLGLLSDLGDPLTLQLYGAHINRDTLGNLHRAGFTILNSDPFWGGAICLIGAQPRRR